MNELCQLEGRALKVKWQLAYFGLKIGYFGHIFLRYRLQYRFFLVSVAQSFVTSATINICPCFFLQLLEKLIPEIRMKPNFC